MKAIPPVTLNDLDSVAWSLEQKVEHLDREIERIDKQEMKLWQRKVDLKELRSATQDAMSTINRYVKEKVKG